MNILQNTLIQLVVRQGTNSDRQTITLKSGEPAYTTDNHRFYVGDGMTKGGKLVGNLFLGSGSTLTNFSPALSGDMAYDTVNHNLNVLTSGDGTNIGHWTPVANLSDQLNIPVMVRYDGLLSSVNFSRNITSSTSSIRLSAGHYRFQYGPLPTSNLISTTQIYGGTPLGYEARTISISNSSCDVKILSSNGASTDAVVTLLINY